MVSSKRSKVPPEAAIYSPDWYAPLTGKTLEVTGLARARFASGGKFHWSEPGERTGPAGAEAIVLEEVSSR